MTVFIVGIDAAEEWLEDCSRVEIRSKLVLVEDRVILLSELPGAALVTVVTAPRPLTADFCTGSSSVLSTIRSCIGIGYICQWTTLGLCSWTYCFRYIIAVLLT